LAIACAETSVASASRVASRASISLFHTVPWQYAIAGSLADCALLRAAIVSMRGAAVNPPLARSRAICAVS
jgi:hypothetical protein